MLPSRKRALAGSSRGGYERERGTLIDTYIICIYTGGALKGLQALASKIFSDGAKDKAKAAAKVLRLLASPVQKYKY